MRNLGINQTRRTPFNAQALLLLLVSALLLMVGYFFRPQLSSVVTPVFARAALGSTLFSNILGSATEKTLDMNALIAENRKLKGQLTDAQTEVLDRNTLYQENMMLKELFGRNPEPNRLLAAVLIRPNATPYDTLIIDVGENTGVKEGDVVSAGGSTVIGTVVQVYARTAKVELYSTPGKTYNGFLRDTIPVQVVGQGGGSLKAEVPYDAKAIEGDTISLPLFAGNTAFVVQHVESGVGDAAPVAYLRLPVSIFGLRFVEVWKQ